MVKILVVDDDEDTRILTSRRLRLKGMEILEASSLKEAIDVLDAVQSEIQVIVTDNDMPDQDDGLLLLKEVQERGLLIPVILMSGRIIESDRDGLRQMGFMEVFCKPVIFQEMMRAIQSR